MAEDRKSWAMSDFRTARNQKAIASNIMEAIAQFRGGVETGAAAEDGRMKIVVRKEDLKQVLEAIRDGRRAAALEQRLNSMRRRQVLRTASQGRGRCGRGTWRPALQSIPEEL